MAGFNEHITQAKNNLLFLEQTNANAKQFWDWQVTVCFYTALHLMNAHIVKKTKKNYISHSASLNVINPYKQMSLAKIPENVYIAYDSLMQLSRRSRYLLNQNFKKNETVDIQPVSLTYDKHFRKAIIHLDTILNYINTTYNCTFENVKLKCVELNKLSFSNFTVVQ